jgi:hypothetical protein
MRQVLVGLLVIGGTARAQNFVGQWEAQATAIQSEQPHWVTPLVTVTPRLEQELRFDLVDRRQPSKTETTIYDNAKGLELIPEAPIELLINAPAYTVHRSKKNPDGWGDWPLLLKARIASANEQNGDYIVTAFLGGTVPTGGHANGNGTGLVTPSIAGGKGWGNFDFQATAGINLFVSKVDALGHPLLYNGALQYRVDKIVWPELELNGTSWRDGNNIGKNQLFLTPGVVVGRLPIHDRIGLTFGAGIQVAVTHFHQYDHAWTLSARMPF